MKPLKRYEVEGAKGEISVDVKSLLGVVMKVENRIHRGLPVNQPIILEGGYQKVDLIFDSVHFSCTVYLAHCQETLRHLYHSHALRHVRGSGKPPKHCRIQHAPDQISVTRAPHTAGSSWPVQLFLPRLRETVHRAYVLEKTQNKLERTYERRVSSGRESAALEGALFRTTRLLIRNEDKTNEQIRGDNLPRQCSSFQEREARESNLQYPGYSHFQRLSSPRQSHVRFPQQYSNSCSRKSSA
mmetsp:Transcript_16200/g.67008  ORF Transcript_16200/g.67008 Transcript_16200/m.67008 type:complete len:242 (-) Transcript_16200:897-1622(-)